LYKVGIWSVYGSYMLACFFQSGHPALREAVPLPEQAMFTNPVNSMDSIS
jgi:hypothetical protein